MFHAICKCFHCCTCPQLSWLIFAFYNIGRTAVPMSGRRKRFKSTSIHAWAVQLCKQEDSEALRARVVTRRPRWKNATRASQTNFHNLISDHDKKNCVLPLKLSWKITPDNLSCLQRKHASVEAAFNLTRVLGGHHSGLAKVSEHQEHSGVSVVSQEERLRRCVPTLGSTADLCSRDNTVTIIQSDFRAECLSIPCVQLVRGRLVKNL